ncbi:PAP2 superfamily-domain-containing protein [Staphylotrichum tortipilum]|uniref:Dolichyldiphosphatase n=1 Tax=Staphylotrichum tortipilum TaxID=2831512 RepID=A0AAN6RV02_9PEZI|nr:PAP2 superfamily-domain-containing protein [Staphylotrichum longicolle]
MADDHITPLASLSLTHVYYNPDDPLSYLGAFLSLLPQALCVVYATLFWSTREAEVLLMFLGQLACEALNFVLKRLIKEERPTTLPGGGPAGKGYGMPSSHAQFAVFWAVAASLFLLVRHRPERVVAAATSRGSSSTTPAPTLADVSRAYRAGGLPAASASIEAYAHGPWTLPQRAFASAGALVVAGLVAWSRVYLGYHTVRQVAAGCVAGGGCAAAWFAVTYLMRETGALAWVLELPPARWLRMRDLVVEEDPCQAGWEKWEARRRVMKEKERERGKGKGKGGKGL